MKRIAWFLWTLLLLVPGAALADGDHVYGKIGFAKPDQITAEVMDVRARTLTGLTVTVSVGPEGGKAGLPIPMREVEPGKYAVAVPPDTPQLFRATVDFHVNGAVFQASVRLDRSEDRAPLLIPVEPAQARTEAAVPAEPETAASAFPWAPVGYGAAAAVGGATVFLMLRRRK